MRVCYFKKTTDYDDIPEKEIYVVCLLAGLKIFAILKVFSGDFEKNINNKKV